MDDLPTPALIGILAVLIILSAFFSATETAFSSLNKIRLKNMLSSGNTKAKLTLEIADRFDDALSAILIGNNIVNIGAASLGTVIFSNWLGSSKGAVTSTIVLTIIVLIFGEVLPKSIAKEYPEKFALAVSKILYALMIIFKPIIKALMFIKKSLRGKNAEVVKAPTMTEEELKFIIEEIEDEGVLNNDESELVQSAIEFNDITVNEVLTPRVNVIAISSQEDIEDIKNIFIDEGYSRIPVYNKSVDNIIGVLNQKDFFSWYVSDREKSVNDLIQTVMYVPPKKNISQLLREFQREKTHLAIVSDHYGGTLGIVTLEDIIEELVGEIWDEGDEIINEIVDINETTINATGDVNMRDLLEHLDIEEQEYNYQSNTLSGFVLEIMEKIPIVGDKFEFKEFEFLVKDVEEQRINLIQILKPKIEQV